MHDDQQIIVLINSFQCKPYAFVCVGCFLVYYCVSCAIFTSMMQWFFELQMISNPVLRF